MHYEIRKNGHLAVFSYSGKSGGDISGIKDGGTAHAGYLQRQSTLVPPSSHGGYDVCSCL